MTEKEFEQLEKDIENLIENFECGLDTLTHEEMGQLVGGYDNRGLKCLTERNYLPDRYDRTTDLGKIVYILRILNNGITDILRERYDDYEWDEDNEEY